MLTSGVAVNSGWIGLGIPGRIVTKAVTFPDGGYADAAFRLDGAGPVDRPVSGEVGLDTLTGELLAVAAQTVEPTKASLWLRDAGRR